MSDSYSVHEKTSADTDRTLFSSRRQDVVDHEPLADEKKDTGHLEASVEIDADPLASRLEPVGFREMFRCVHLIVFSPSSNRLPASLPRRRYL